MSTGSALLPLLRSRVQGDVLALTFLHPASEYSLTDLARQIGASVRAVHHEAERLVGAGFLLDRRQGNNRLVRAAVDTVIAGPLTDLLAVTHGPLPVLRDLVAGVDGVEEAWIFGSWAARYLGEPGLVPDDVDVLVVGDVDRDELDDLARTAERTLVRPVNAVRIRPEAWLKAHQSRALARAAEPDDPFLASVLARPRIRLDPIPDNIRSGGAVT